MSYEGHHPVHTGLQKHSVGARYPYTPVFIAGAALFQEYPWSIMDCSTGKLLATPLGTRRAWATAEEALAWLDSEIAFIEKGGALKVQTDF